MTTESPMFYLIVLIKFALFFAFFTFLINGITSSTTDKPKSKLWLALAFVSIVVGIFVLPTTILK